MTKAPSIKEALTNIAAISACVAVVDNPTSHVEMLSKINAISVGALKALATLQPDGERREAIANLIDDLVDAVHDYEVHVGFHDVKHYREGLQNARRALDTAIDAGLVQDEAGIRASQREIDAKSAIEIASYFSDPYSGPCGEAIARRIRSARDGGAS